MNGSLALDFHLAIVFGFGPFAAASRHRKRHWSVRRNAISLPLNMARRSAVECIQAALPTKDARTRRRHDVHFLTGDALSPVGSHGHLGDLTWVNITKEFLVRPSATTRCCSSSTFLLVETIALLVSSSWSAAYFSLCHGHITPSRTFTLLVVVVLLKPWRWSSSAAESFESLAVPSLRDFAVCQVGVRGSVSRHGGGEYECRATARTLC
jgi:hypothetical protein